jgi:hypothetical protein
VHSAGARPPGPCAAQCLATPVPACARVWPRWRPVAPAAATARMQHASPACASSDVAGCTALCVELGARLKEVGLVARLRRRLNVRAPRRAPRRRRRALPARARPPRRAPRRRRRALPACARPLRRAASRLQPRAQPRRRVCATKSAPPRSGGWEDRWYKERRPTPGLSCARGVLQGSADGHGELTACLDLALHEQVHWHQGCNQSSSPPECELR